MTSFTISDRLLRSRLVASGCRDAVLASAYETGEALTRKASGGPQPKIARIAAQFISKGPRLHPTSPDRDRSRGRRRSWGGSSGMPDNIRTQFTEGERAALSVVAHEVKRSGCCDLAIDRIAAIAGVSRTTVQNAVRKARSKDLGYLSVEERPRPGRKNLTNIIRIISNSWVAWLKRSIGFKRVNPTKIKTEKNRNTEIVALPKGAWEGEQAGRAVANTGDVRAAREGMHVGNVVGQGNGRQGEENSVLGSRQANLPDRRGVVPDFPPAWGTGAGRNAL